MATRVHPVLRTSKIRTSRTKEIRASRVTVTLKVPTAMVVVSNSSQNSSKLNPVPAIAMDLTKKSSNSRFNLAS